MTFGNVRTSEKRSLLTLACGLMLVTGGTSACRGTDAGRKAPINSPGPDALPGGPGPDALPGGPGPDALPGGIIADTNLGPSVVDAGVIFADVADGASPFDTNDAAEAKVDASSGKADAAVAAFTALPSMGVPRRSHTVTVLADGRILIVGGQYDLYDSKNEYGSTTKVTATAELYDPDTETFTPTGSLAMPRYGHTATLLVDGTVLIAGGYTDSDFAGTAEVYDPTSGRFRPTGTMLTPRTGATATRLEDGQVLFVGGHYKDELTNCEVYEPNTGTFAATGSLTSARQAHTATLLADGRVLVVGGDAFAVHPGFVTAELFDPAKRTFSITGALSARRDAHTATLLRDGRVLIAGGEGDGDSSLGQEDFASAEIYDPEKGTFSMTGSMATQRFGHSATLLANGKVLIAAGMNHLASATYLSSAELFDPATGTFSKAGSLVGVRTGHRAALLASGKVLLVGGSQNPNSAEVYDPATGIFYSRDLPRVSHTATLLANGKVLFSAKPDPMNQFAVTHGVLYDPSARIFTATGDMVRGRSCHSATRLLDGRVFFAGSSPWTNTPSLLRTELYDPGSGAFTPTPTILSRCSHTATLLPDGRVFLAGGNTNGDTTEIFDAKANIISPAASLASARYGHTATLLPNGTVLMAGGWGSEYKTLASAEIFDPSGGTITPANAMASPRTGHTATALRDGRVLIVGGWSGTSTSSGKYVGKPLVTSELFDPATGVFQPSGSLANARFSHAATVLPDGRIMIVGGSDSMDPSRNVTEPHPLASAEIFDPATGLFTPAPPMTFPRVGSTATALADGAILVVGGNAAGLEGHETVARVEIFR